MPGNAEVAREQPIWFSGPMIRAILRGRKAQTRRVIKPQPPADRDRCWVEYPHGKPIAAYKSFDTGSATTGLCECPYGQSGDRLWVRENWAAERQYDVLTPRDVPATSTVWYAADLPATDSVSPGLRRMGKGRPSIFMPRWASRITLEITDVRVERLAVINTANCIAEGISPTMRNDAPAKERFRILWDSINGKRAGCDWASNPWVWAISFKRLEQ